MGLRRCGQSGSIPGALDLLQPELRDPVWIFVGLDSRPHCRLGGRCGDDLFVARDRGGNPLSGVSRSRHPSGMACLCRSSDRHLRRRDCLVVAYGSARMILPSGRAEQEEASIACSIAVVLHRAGTYNPTHETSDTNVRKTKHRSQPAQKSFERLPRAAAPRPAAMANCPRRARRVSCPASLAPRTTTEV